MRNWTSDLRIPRSNALPPSRKDYGERGPFRTCLFYLHSNDCLGQLRFRPFWKIAEASKPRSSNSSNENDIDDLFLALSWCKLNLQKLNSHIYYNVQDSSQNDSEYLSFQFVFRNNDTSYRLRNSTSLHQLYEKKFSNKGAEVWNSLSQDLRSVTQCRLRHHDTLNETHHLKHEKKPHDRFYLILSFRLARQNYLKIIALI